MQSKQAPAAPPSASQETIRGVVLSRTNRGLETSCLLRDVTFGEVVERRIKMYSPLIQEVKLLQQAFIHKGKKRVRRSKLYYLRDRDPVLCKVTGVQFGGTKMKKKKS